MWLLSVWWQSNVDTIRDQGGVFRWVFRGMRPGFGDGKDELVLVQIWMDDSTADVLDSYAWPACWGCIVHILILAFKNEI